MRIINVSSPNMALHAGIAHLHFMGDKVETRNGPAIVSPGPVITNNTHPTNRVIMGNTRDANPFFHIMESMWIIAGRRDLEPLQRMVKRFGEFSDDGKTLYGAYGYRLRHWFGYDQIEAAVDALRSSPGSRRVVLAMWDGGQSDTWDDGAIGCSDLEQGLSQNGKDVPCNTHIYLNVRGGALTMTICCRSNDAIWGAHGANTVHFSFLLEYLAARLGMPIGPMVQFSNDYHAYESALPKEHTLASYSKAVLEDDFYRTPTGGVREAMSHVQLLGNDTNDALMADINEYFATDGTQQRSGDRYLGSTAFFTKVFSPMMAAWAAHKAGDSAAAQGHARQIVADDWRTASKQWINKRTKKESV